jgi:hypothetical protein
MSQRWFDRYQNGNLREIHYETSLSRAYSRTVNGRAEELFLHLFGHAEHLRTGHVGLLRQIPGPSPPRAREQPARLFQFLIALDQRIPFRMERFSCAVAACFVRKAASGARFSAGT